MDFYRRTVATRCGRGKGATATPVASGTSLPFDINFARRRPHLAPDLSASRYTTRKCGRFGLCGVGEGLSPHVAQDRQNFGTDGVADPDRVEVAHEHVYRRQRRPLSEIVLVRALPAVAAAEYRNPPLGLTLILALHRQHLTVRGRRFGRGDQIFTLK